MATAQKDRVIETTVNVNLDKRCVTQAVARQKLENEERQGKAEMRTPFEKRRMIENG